jgi:hypothetical protein
MSRRRQIEEPPVPPYIVAAAGYAQNPKPARKKQSRQDAQHYAMTRDLLVAQLKAAKHPRPHTKANEVVAAQYGLSVDALIKAIERAKK